MSVANDVAASEEAAAARHADLARLRLESENPTRLAPRPGLVGGRVDHHAFLYWPRTGLVVIPFEQRAVGYRVGRGRGIDPAGRIEHEAGKLGWTPGVRRSMVVRDSVPDGV